MIDVHCHLVDNKFKDDIDDVISRAREANVSRVVVVPEYVSSSQFVKVIDLKRRYPDFVVASIGIHPIQKRNRSVRLSDLDTVESFVAAHQELIGCIGEVGLDFTTPQFKISADDRLVQKEVLRRQVRLAQQFDLPLNVHSRSAAADTVSVLAELDARRVVLHAFDGNADDVARAIQLGYCISIPPSYSIGNKRADLVQAVPLDQLLLETDSPVLGPEKGKRNEPANCKVSAEFIAEVLGISFNEVVTATTRNVSRLFKL